MSKRQTWDTKRATWRDERWTDGFWDSGAGFIIGFVLFTAAILATGAAIIGGVMAATQSWSMPATIAQIEQLRADSADVDPAQAEDVIGQVTQWNQAIREAQAANDQWWSGWVTPDQWDEIEPIPVPVSDR